MKLAYETGAEEYILSSFNLETDEEGFVVDGGVRVTDASGIPIKSENVAKVITLDSQGLSVSEGGLVINEHGERVSHGQQAIIPVELNGSQDGLLRDGFWALSDYVNASDD